MRYQIGKFAGEMGDTAAVRKFRNKFPKLNESTVRGFRKKYQLSLKSSNKKGMSPVKEIAAQRHERTLLLGNNIDQKVGAFLLALRNRGGRVSYSIAIATAKVLIERSNHVSTIVPGVNWAQSLFRPMGFNRRAATTGKVDIPHGARKEAELTFLHDIVSKEENNKVPPSMILNLDQTPSKYIQSSRYTMESKGSKSVAIARSGDKRAITATFVITLEGSFLPMQLIYGGKTSKSLPAVEFPEGFSLSVNPSHYSNIEESIKIMEEIVIPYLERERKKHDLPIDYPAILIVDVFRGQMTAPVLKLLKKNHILLIKVPNNMTNLFQPLDLTVNSLAKAFMKEKFAQWFASQIRQGLDSNKDIEDIEIKTPLSVLKPLHAQWLIDLYNELTSSEGRKVVINGWRASGIADAIDMGSKDLPPLDPFAEINGISVPSVHFNSGEEYPENSHPNVNSRENDDSESEYELEIDDGNAFDIIE